jgi:hypothetical protein
MSTKEFKTWLVVDWKSGQFRVCKKKPDRLKSSEIPIDIKLNVQIPETPVLKAHGEITLSQAKVNEMILEEL